MEDLFKEVVNHAIKPVMKSAGFKKKALNFYRNHNGLIYLINIQKSYGNSHAELCFYVNCCIHSNVIEEEVNGSTVEFPKEYQCHYRDRIEEIVENVPEEFVLNSSVNIQALKGQVEKAFREVTELFEKISDNAAFVVHVSKHGTLKEDEIFRYCLRNNLAEEAESLVGLFKQNIDQERWEDVFRGNFREIVQEEGSKLEIEDLK